MIRWFLCPDGEKIEIGECLNECRMEEECAPLPYLELVAHDRAWRGVTASMAGTGSRQLFLKRTCEYAISPDRMAFAVLGTGAHGKLAEADYNKLVEERLPEGTADLLEPDRRNPGKYIITDYKSFGSYKVAQALGLIKMEKKRGSKSSSLFVVDEARIDRGSEELQINKYRIGFERCGFPISRMRIFAIIRDGGLWIAKSRGVMTNTKIIPIKRLDNDVVECYYKDLSDAIELAMESGYAPICNKDQRWGGIRCKSYCDVSAQCRDLSKAREEKTWEQV